MKEQSSRELVISALNFNYPSRVPRHMWVLPWAENHYPQQVARIREEYPDDICYAPDVYGPAEREEGDRFAAGDYVDPWGCVFSNVQEGIIGEVKTAPLADDDDPARVKPPYEMLPADRKQARETVNRFCENTDKFVIGQALPRPWERYQFLRGTENAFIDLMTRPDYTRHLLDRLHRFFLLDLDFWLETKVDAIWFMDDWGTQNQLLIPPHLWRELFKPLYADYCRVAHEAGKYAFMHSDGHISAIYDDLIEVGVDAVNSQVFCMDMAQLGRDYRGRITFWGEIDRQHVLPSTDPERGRRAVREVAGNLYDPAGGVIAQFEFGPGGNPETALTILQEWDNKDREPHGRTGQREMRAKD